MFLDITPGGGKRQKVSKNQIQKIKTGGVLGDKIRKIREEDHKENEVPRAEMQMDIALNNWPKEKPEQTLTQEEKHTAERTSIWQKIKKFFHS